MKERKPKKELTEKISVTLKGSTIKMLDKLALAADDSRSKILQRILDKSLK